MKTLFENEIREIEVALSSHPVDREKLEASICNFFCDVRLQENASTKVIRCLATLTIECGSTMVCEWIQIAYQNLPEWKSDGEFLKYIYGIRRKVCPKETDYSI